jgi:hypothetical protein
MRLVFGRLQISTNCEPVGLLRRVLLVRRLRQLAFILYLALLQALECLILRSHVGLARDVAAVEGILKGVVYFSDCAGLGPFGLGAGACVPDHSLRRPLLFLPGINWSVWTFDF